MIDPRVIGYIVAVQGFRVKVELLPEARSPSRATLDGVHTSVAINAYLAFSIGAGDTVIGIITDLEARETFDPSSGDELTLELVKPRRVASVQLLGTIERDGRDTVFSPGITVLPTLDTPAEIGSPEIMRSVFENPPRRNKPDGYEKEDFDFDLSIGFPTGQRESRVKASYNDLFSRPLAIVGNTGSGKSYTVSSLIQKAMALLSNSMAEPHIFLLDINGEYGRAFLSQKQQDQDRKPDRIYLDGKEFGIPLWFFNAQEICSWLSASEQTQEPVLKDWWALAKGQADQSALSPINGLQNAVSSIDTLLADLSTLKRKSAGSYCDAICGHLVGAQISTANLEALFTSHRTVDKFNTEILNNQAQIVTCATELQNEIRTSLSKATGAIGAVARTADSPIYVSRQTLIDPSMINRAVSKEDTFRVESHLTTLKLRLKTRIDDARWHSFLNYEVATTKTTTLTDWLQLFGLGSAKGSRVSIIDLSMLSHEVLPFATSVIGRVLLEVREQLPAAKRYTHPWVLVLEEAHNYARPPRSDEDRGQALSRLAFERIAKEGRKFGLSLIVASQRPSEISPTIISQCANFISHRLQNPDDIDHFRRIIPMQARRLLDQVTILASGEAIVFGSAFHIPSRVQIDAPNPGPWSQTAAPYHEWKTETSVFPLKDLIASEEPLKRR
jgi:uncharacterized protein